MRTLSPLPLFAALLLSCGTDPSAGPPGPSGPTGPMGEKGERGADGTGGGGDASGSRIKIRYVSTPDGLKSRDGYHDSKLDAACTFRRLNGVFRCVPDLMVRGSMLAFNSGSCARDPVLLVSKNYPNMWNCESERRFVYLAADATGGCFSALSGRVFRAMPRPAVSSATTIDSVSGKCVEVTSASAFDAYAVEGAEVQETEFIKGDFSTTP